MSKVQEVILANAADHARLLTAIGKLEYVPSAMRHQISHIEDLEGQLAAIQKEIPQLVEETKKKRKKHESLRDSTMRFAYKWLGKAEKYEAKVNKTEREYVEAFQRQVIAQNNHPGLEERLKEGYNELMNLIEKEQRLLSLQAELTALYDRVFDGSTEAFPEDDRLKDALLLAEKYRDEIQANVTFESQVAEKLAAAVGYMDRCESKMRKALKYSTKLHYGSAISGSLSRSPSEAKLEDALKSAQTDASQAEKFVSEAVRASSLVKPVTRVHIPLHALKDQIEQLIAQVIWCNQELKTEWSSARLRLDAPSNQLQQASRTFDRCRRELHEFRKATFESYIDYSKV